MQLLQTIIAFIIALGVLVVIHELGHYLVARWCDVKVLRFSFGFGRVLWSRRAGRDGTEWAICAFPLGGYVKMLDEREAEEGGIPASELHRAFNRKPVGARSLIVLAGPVANFLLAIAVYWVLFMVGHNELSPVLGTIKPESAAAQAGLRAEDRVLAINGDAVKSWTDLRWAVIEEALDQGSLQVSVKGRDGTHAVRQLSLAGVTIDDRQPDPMQQLGISMPAPHVPAVVGDVQPGSAAAKAGLRSDDRIMSIDGQPTAYFQDVFDVVSSRPGKQVEIVLERRGRQERVQASIDSVPDVKPARGRLGIGMKPVPGAEREYMESVRYGPVAAMTHALSSTWATTSFSLKVMWRMIRGDVSLRNVSGPLTIADYAGKSAKAGLDAYVSFIALVSISLGVLNLLPVPLLDGGHLLYYVAEIIRGKPLSERVMELGQRAGLAFLGCLMVLAFFNDINRQFSGLG